MLIGGRLRNELSPSHVYEKVTDTRVSLCDALVIV